MSKEEVATWIMIVAGTTAIISTTLDLLDRARGRKKPHKRKQAGRRRKRK